MTNKFLLLTLLCTAHLISHAQTNLPVVKGKFNPNDTASFKD